MKFTTPRNASSIFFILATLGGLFLLFQYTASKFMSVLPFARDNTEYALHIAIIGVIFYFYKYYDTMVLVVKSQEAQASTSLFAPKIEMTIAPADPLAAPIVEKVDNLRIHRQGVHFLAPWESPLMRVIHLVDCSMIIKSGKDKNDMTTYTSKNKVRLTVRWSVVVRPNPDKLNRYFLFTEEAVRTVIKGVIDQKLSDLCGQKSSEWILSHKDQISATVAHFFDGAGSESYYERFYGIRVDDPILSDIDMENEDRKAEAEIARVALIKATADEIVENSKDASGKPTIGYEEAFRRVSIAMGQTKEMVNTNSYKGLDNATSIIMDGRPNK